MVLRNNGESQWLQSKRNFWLVPVWFIDAPLALREMSGDDIS
jgi:hypothetical protein